MQSDAYDMRVLGSTELYMCLDFLPDVKSILHVVIRRLNY